MATRSSRGQHANRESTERNRRRASTPDEKHSRPLGAPAHQVRRLIDYLTEFFPDRTLPDEWPADSAIRLLDELRSSVLLAGAVLDRLDLLSDATAGRARHERARVAGWEPTEFASNSSPVVAFRFLPELQTPRTVERWLPAGNYLVHGSEDAWMILDDGGSLRRQITSGDWVVLGPGDRWQITTHREFEAQYRPLQ